MKVYKRKHYKGQKHYSGKELLERRKAEREAEQKEYEKRLQEEEGKNSMFPIRFPASILYDFKITTLY